MEMSNLSTSVQYPPRGGTQTLPRMNSIQILGDDPSPPGKIARETSTSSSSGKPKSMLTSSQLSDLFRRLDKDGTGELDLGEFLAIASKLKLVAPEDYFVSVFN